MRNIPMRITFIVAVPVIVAAVAFMRLWGSGDEPTYSPPPALVDPERRAEAVDVIERLTNIATEKAGAALDSMNASTAESFGATLATVLQAYNSGTEEAFVNARRSQGFGVPDDWRGTDWFRQKLTAQAGLFERMPTPEQIKVTPRVTAGFRAPEPQPARGIHRTSGTVGIARGEGDILDPVAETADVLEVSFPHQIRDIDGQTASGILRVWLAKRPTDSRWLVYRVTLEYHYQDLPGAVVLPPL